MGINGATISRCVKCGEHTFVTPLHDDKGGPLMCPICAGKWHAEHSRRRKWGKIIIKAMKFYQKEGGLWDDFEKMKIASSDLLPGIGTELLGYEADTIGAEVGDITAELLADTIQLTHPDKHPPENQEMAKRVTQELLALKPFVFPAPKPEPFEPRRPREQRDASFKRPAPPVKDPLQPQYPCETCASTVSLYYCDPCRAEWERRIQEERHNYRERRNPRQRELYAARQWRRRTQTTPCAICGEEFQGKRKDAKFCSATCRQRAYRQRQEVTE